MKFPETTATRTLNLGVILISRDPKQIVILDVNVSWEDRVDEVNGAH